MILGAYVLGLSIADLPADWFAMLVLAIILPFIAVVTGDIKRFLIALIILDTSLSLDVKLFFRPTFASLDGLYFSLTTISLIILYSLWAAELLQSEVKIDLCKSLSLPALFFITMGLLSTLNSKDLTLSAFELVLNVELFLMFFYLANNIKHIKDIRFILNILLVGFCLVALSVIAMQFLGGLRFMGLGSETIDIGADRFVRSGGIFYHPNATAAYLMSLSMLALATILSRGTTGFGRFLALVALPLGVLALILTFSRAGWISFAVAGLVFSLLGIRQKWLRWQHVFLLVAVLALLLFVLREPILYRIFADDRGSISSRRPLNIIAFNMIKSHPWIGVGINNFKVVAQDYHTVETIGAWLAPVHNKYLLVWSETGTLGLVAFILFYLSIGREAWQTYKSDHPMLSVLSAALLASLCGYATHMMVDIFGSRSLLHLLWLFAALAFIMRKLIVGRNNSATT